MLKTLFLAMGLLLAKENLAKEEKQNLGAFRQDVNTTISQPRQITFTGPRAGEGYFSADGDWMIFQAERESGNPFYQMYLLNLKTGQTRRLSPGQGKTTCGWIHPQMKKVMWSSTHLDPQFKKKADEEFNNRKQSVRAKYAWSYDENFDIFESDLNGKSLKRLTKELGYDAEGSYSPDGQFIAFASNRAGYTEKLSKEEEKIFKQDPSFMMDIYIMKADGTQVKRLTTTRGYDGGPFFSPDGRKITWRRFAPNGATAEVYTMNIDGSDQKAITRLNAMSWAPYYHPSGDYLIFASSALGFHNFELFIVDAEGKKDPVRVSFQDDFDGLSVFSPDGHQLAWTHRNQKGESQIYLADWDDAQARRLLDLPARKISPEHMSPSLSKNDIKDIIRYLASSQMAGRRAGSEEEKVYTAEIVRWLKAWGLSGGGPKGEFLQPFSFTSGVTLGSKNSLDFVGKMKTSLKVSEEFEPLSQSQTGDFREAPIVFAGYGIKAPATDKAPEYDSYKGLDVKGKWVLVLRDIPEDVAPERKHQLNLYGRLHHKVTVARNEGAIGILFAYGPQSSLKDHWGPLKYDGAGSGGTESSLAVLRVKNKWAEDLVALAGQNLGDLQKKLNAGEAVAGFSIPSTYIKASVDLQFVKSEGLNILAKLNNGGKKAIMIGAHGDHLGRGEFGNSLARGDEKGQAHFGADDNASGVAGVLELAHFFSDLKKRQPHLLKKDLYFAIWSAEEIGVLGSTHFTKSWNQISKAPLKSFFSAQINMDMIGRMKDQLFMQGVGSGDNWSRLAEEMTLKTGLPISLQSDPYLPTDSMSFYLAEIPSISFFTGVHSEYHSPRDTWELINDSGEERILGAIQGLVQVLADSQVDLVKYVKVGSEGRDHSGGGRSFRIFLGTIPDYSQEGVKGVRISGVSKESPAEKAGLKEKDVIVEFSGSKIENIYDYVYALQTAKPNQETLIKVQRDQGALVELKIIPKLKE